MQPIEAPHSFIATLLGWAAAFLSSSAITLIIKGWFDRRAEQRREQAQRSLNEARARSIDNESLNKTSDTILDLFVVIDDQSKTISAERMRADRAEVRVEQMASGNRSMALQLRQAREETRASLLQMQTLHAAASLKNVRLAEFTPNQLKEAWEKIEDEIRNAEIGDYIDGDVHHDVSGS